MTRSLRDSAIAARTIADDTFAAWCAGKATGEAVNNTARVAAFAERRADMAEAAGPYPSIRVWA